MSSWTKVTDESDGFTKVQDTLIPYDSGDYSYDDDLYYDNTTQYDKVADASSVWASFGGLIHLATEGLRKLIMTEDSTDYIVVSKGAESGTWTDVSDASTSYTKVIDA